MADTPQPLPNADILAALGLSAEDWQNFVVDPDKQKQILQIQAEINKVPAAARKQLLQQLQQNVNEFTHPGGPAGVLNFLSNAYTPATVDYGALLRGVQTATKPATSAAQQQQTQAAQTSSQALQQQYGVPSVPFGQAQPPSAPIPNDWKTLSDLTGYDAQAGYQHYVSNFALGQQAQQRLGQPVSQPMSVAQWFGQQQQNVMGPWSPLLQSFDAQYQLQTGQQMPFELQMQLLDQIHNLAPNMRNELLAQMPQIKQAVATYASDPSRSDAAQNAAGALALVGATQSSPAGPGSALYNTFYQYTAAVPSQQTEQNKALQQNVSSFVSLMGRAPSSDEVRSITGMDYTSLQRYVDSLPAPIQGMTMGTYNAATTNMKQLWRDNFAADPSEAEIRKFAGWNKDELSRWVNSQPSKENPDMTIGKRNSYIGLADQVSNKWFGGPADSRMVDALGQKFGTDVTGAAKS